MKEKKLYKIAFMGNKDHGCDIISTLESWGGSNYYTRTGSDPEYVYFINDLGTIDFIHNSEMLSKEMKNFYFLFWHDYNIECQLKVGESINYGGQDYDVDSILFDANNRCIVYKLKSFGIGVEYITNNELTPTEEYQTEEENNEYLCENNMGKKIAIKGHPTRGKEVVELLEMMGGTNPFSNNGMVIGNKENNYYYISENTTTKYISWDYIGLVEIDKYEIFTLEEFLEKYPYKVGDKVVYEDDNDIVVISEIKWDNTVGDIFYNVKRIDDDDDCFLCPPELLKPYKETNMNKKLAIRGHSTRGKEVIEILEMMGGKNNCDSPANNLGLCYLIDDEFDICANYFGYDDYEDGELNIFTLEEFLEKYPFKVGDKVFLYDNITEGCVTGMEWDEIKGTVKYCVYTSSECWCDVKELLKWNNVDLVERHYMDNMEEKDKAKAPIIKGEDYSGKRFGYKIPDGYEFDVVVDGKIILKPIKPKYPETYVECCEMIANSKPYAMNEHYADVNKLLQTFQTLFICRNAYWKIAGEQMGLGKPWEPDWKNSEEKRYCIVNIEGDINLPEKVLTKWILKVTNKILVFPTAEMRDAFYEAFKKEIEICKELL